MSRVDDLIALVQSANDVYLVNPNRNARMAYILVDDICELAMKSRLQMNVPGWTPVSHQHNGRDYYKGFRTVIAEVKNANSGNQDLAMLLDRFETRREQRNHFFHNQDLSGLTVTEEECVRALCDLYDLLQALYGNDCRTSLESNKIAQAQIVVVRLKRAGYAAHWVYDRLREVVSWEITLRPGSLAHEYRTIYDDPQGFLAHLRTHFADLIAQNQAEKVRKRKGGRVLRFTRQDLRRAERHRQARAHQKQGRNRRAAVEATVRSLKHPFAGGKAPVRGQFRVAYMVIGVAAVVNIRRLHRALQAGNKSEAVQAGQEKGARRENKGQEEGLSSFMRRLRHALTGPRPRWASTLVVFSAW